MDLILHRSHLWEQGEVKPNMSQSVGYSLFNSRDGEQSPLDWSEGRGAHHLHVEQMLLSG